MSMAWTLPRIRKQTKMLRSSWTGELFHKEGWGKSQPSHSLLPQNSHLFPSKREAFSYLEELCLPKGRMIRRENTNLGTHITKQFEDSLLRYLAVRRSRSTCLQH